jgi:hypothetical protein
MDKHQWTIIARQYAGIFDRLTTRQRQPHQP